MTIQTIIEKIGIELLVFAICMFYGIRLIVTKDVGIINKANKDTIKHPEEYAYHGGIIIVFLGIAVLLMGVLSFVSPVAAAVEIIIGVLVMGFMWKNMHEKYS